eukprot:Opistho-1_new@24527
MAKGGGELRMPVLHIRPDRLVPSSSAAAAMLTAQGLVARGLPVPVPGLQDESLPPYVANDCLVHSVEEAEAWFAAAKAGTAQILRRHLSAEEKNQIAAGHVYIYDADYVERWTDNLTWSKAYSTKNGWLIYNEVEVTASGDGSEKVRKRKKNGICKKIISHAGGKSSLRLVAYFEKGVAGTGATAIEKQPAQQHLRVRKSVGDVSAEYRVHQPMLDYYHQQQQLHDLMAHGHFAQTHVPTGSISLADPYDSHELQRPAKRMRMDPAFALPAESDYLHAAYGQFAVPYHLNPFTSMTATAPEFYVPVGHVSRRQLCGCAGPAPGG